jgi:hypothetical protein
MRRWKIVVYSPTVVANNILSRAFAEKITVTPMKLQKILYFVASEYQKATKMRLFEEPFLTWAYGPVLYSVFNEFKSFSKENISRYARDARNRTLIVDESKDEALRGTLDQIWNATRYKGAIELSELTHAEDSAWDRAFQEDEETLQSKDILSDETYRQQLGL